jgi:hypothetical protein
MKRIQRFQGHYAFSFLATVFLAACSSTQPRPVANYASYLNEPEVQSRQVVPMYDSEAKQQKAGTTLSRKTATTESASRNGRLKKQTSTKEEILETESSRVVEIQTVPTSDQDVR